MPPIMSHGTDSGRELATYPSQSRRGARSSPAPSRPLPGFHQPTIYGAQLTSSQKSNPVIAHAGVGTPRNSSSRSEEPTRVGHVRLQNIATGTAQPCLCGCRGRRTSGWQSESRSRPHSTTEMTVPGPKGQTVRNSGVEHRAVRRAGGPLNGNRLGFRLREPEPHLYVVETEVRRPDAADGSAVRNQH